MDTYKRFDKYEDEFLKFERVENKKCSRPDLHAFLLLNELFPGDKDIVQCACHDQIYLDVDDEQAETLTDEQIIELQRCGVFYDEESLTMFV